MDLQILLIILQFFSMFQIICQYVPKLLYLCNCITMVKYNKKE